MSLQINDLMAAIKEWITLSTDLEENQTIRSHQNGPAGAGSNLPYAVIQPVVSANRLGLQASVLHHEDSRYRVELWEIVSLIEVHRGEPFEILQQCESGLMNPKTRKQAFHDRKMVPMREGDILIAPQIRGQFWEPQGQMRIKTRLNNVVLDNTSPDSEPAPAEMRKLQGVRFTLYDPLLFKTQLITP